MKKAITRLHAITGSEKLPFLAVCGKIQLLVTKFHFRETANFPQMMRGTVLHDLPGGADPGTEKTVIPAAEQWFRVEVIPLAPAGCYLDHWHRAPAEKTAEQLLAGIPEQGAQISKAGLVSMAKEAFARGAMAESRNPFPGQ